MALSMAAKVNIMISRTVAVITLIYNFFVYQEILGSILNVQELKDTNFGVDIINTPVLKGQVPTSHSVYLSSRYGQEYECTYVDRGSIDSRKQEQERAAMETGIPKLLQPMQSEPCLKKTIHWWTYELCYLKHILQYHIEGELIAPPLIKLGLYESQFDWSNETAKKTFMKTHRLFRYHTQHYSNGSLCDLTQKPRSAEIRFVCEEDVSDYIHRVDEPQPCSYVITVRTSRICHHPYLRAHEPTHDVPIKCHPVLSPTDYAAYLKSEKERKARSKKRDDKDTMNKRRSAESDEVDKSASNSESQRSTQDADPDVTESKDSSSASNAEKELGLFKKLLEKVSNDGSDSDSSDSKSQIKVIIRAIPLDGDVSGNGRENEGEEVNEDGDTELPSASKASVRDERGNDIKVEIVSAHIINNGEVKSVTGIGNNQIKNVIRALLGDTSDAVSEENRIRSQEVAYRYNWKRRVSRSSNDDL